MRQFNASYCTLRHCSWICRTLQSNEQVKVHLEQISLGNFEARMRTIMGPQPLVPHLSFHFQKPSKHLFFSWQHELEPEPACGRFRTWKRNHWFHHFTSETGWTPDARIGKCGSKSDPVFSSQKAVRYRQKSRPRVVELNCKKKLCQKSTFSKVQLTSKKASGCHWKQRRKTWKAGVSAYFVA